MTGRTPTRAVDAGLYSDLKVRLEQEKLCLLVMLGVRADGRKELVAITDGYRESTESWADPLRGCRRRGMTAPVLAVGDGALGFWKAVREVSSDTKEQRCWLSRQANGPATLPKSAHLAALAALKDIYNAADIDKAQLAIKALEIAYGAQYPRAVATIISDPDTLLEFYHYPAKHWIHPHTTNPIESTFATARLRTKVTKGARSRAAGLATTYKLIDAARPRCRAGQRRTPGRPGPRRSRLLQRQTPRTPTDITPPEPTDSTDATAGTEVT